MDLQEEFNKLDLQKCFMGGFLLAVIYWVLFFDNGAAIDAQIIQTQGSIQKNKTVLVKVRKALENKKKYEKEIKDIALNMQDFQKVFYQDMDSDGLQAKVSEIAEQVELTVNSLAPTKKKSEFKDYSEEAVTFKVEGPFHNIMHFIARLTDMGKAIDFSKMRFKSKVQGDEPLVELETTLVVYSSLDDFEGEN